MATATNKLFVRDVLLTSRPFWWITTAAPFATGFLVADGVHWSWLLVIGTAYFAFSYNLLLHGLNDIFDYESDIRNPRKAGIDGGVLAKAKHLPLLLVIVLTNIPFLTYLLGIGNSS